VHHDPSLVDLHGAARLQRLGPPRAGATVRLLMRVVALTLAALALGSAVAGAATVPRPTSGLRGIVMRGPTMPVCIETKPCEEPAVGLVLEFRRAGRLVARAKTGPVGGYTVRLRPGAYAVTTPRRRVGTGLTPRAVRVPGGRLARIDFHLDTGIQ
jgi:hypothetical protein